MSPAISSIPLDIVPKTGPRVIGSALYWALFGVLSAQVYIYFLAFPNDPLRNKFFVYGVYVLELLQTGIVAVTFFRAFGTGFGDYAFLDQIGASWFSIPILSGLAFLADIFYAYRISVLAESYWVAGSVVFLAVTQLAGSIAQGVEMQQVGLFSGLLGTQFKVATAFWNGGSALCDVIIAVCMAFYLTRRGSELGMPSTQRLLRRVVTLIIGSGAATASIAILNLLLTALSGHPGDFIASAEILAKVYSNSMMVLLNRRIEFLPEFKSLPENLPWSPFYPEIHIQEPEVASSTSASDQSTGSGAAKTMEQSTANIGYGTVDDRETKRHLFEKCKANGLHPSHLDRIDA